jgi:hypothetical protein
MDDELLNKDLSPAKLRFGQKKKRELVNTSDKNWMTNEGGKSSDREAYDSN